MKFVISGGLNAKVVGRAIHCLGKIGDELYIECSTEKVEFRTVNSSHSAYARFSFARAFFTEYETDGGSEEDDKIKCKIPMKSLLSVFKCLAFLEKNVEQCKFELSSESDVIVIQLHCKHEIVKTFNLFLIDCKTVQAVYSKEDCPNGITGEGRVFYEAVQNFQPNQEEVTLIVSENKTTLKNYADDDDLSKAIHTEVILEPEEFSDYRIDKETELTFCLKELKAILFFSEPSNYEISINFETGGRPLIFSMSESEATFEADFVLATSSVNHCETTSVSSDSSYQLTKGRHKVAPTKSKRTNSKTKSTSKEIQKAQPDQSSAAKRNRPRLGDLIQDNNSRDCLETGTVQDDSRSDTPPPLKRIRSLFLGLLETPLPRIEGEVLAPDSEEDEETT